ncbi:hypothetical protein NECID01_1928 [Nematocida sp. AWRm77]|nr:hypothetical protein NECID01_1928 [Nematocida sp. AWRm77]
MKVKDSNALLSMKCGRKETEKLALQIEAKKKKLSKLSLLLQKHQSVEVSIAYLLAKREVDRLERVSRIVRREAQRDAENEWVRKGSTEQSADIQKFQKVTKQYYSYFPTLSFFHRDVPLEYYSHVQALERCGVLEIGESLVETEKDSLYFVRKKEVSHLISAGLMKVMRKSTNK